MCNWIDIKVHQPINGQTVLLLGSPLIDPELPYSSQTNIIIGRWEGLSALPAKLIGTPTHWAYLPTIRRKSELQKRLAEVDPDLLSKCHDIEKKLAERAPLITWTVEPDSLIDHTWIVRGEINVNGQIAFTERFLSYEMLISPALDWPSYFCHEIASAISRELVK